MRIENEKWIDIFTNMEHMRFNDLKHIKTYLQNHFVGAKINLNFKSYIEDDYFPSDFEIICSIQNDGKYLIDLDLYYLYDRKNMLYITETGAEEQ